MGTKKSRPLITVEEVPTTFDDACIARLAKIARLPLGAHLALFAEGIRQDVRIFATEAGESTNNELHDEIGRLFRAVERKQYEKAAELLERASPQALELLQGRADRHGIKLPGAGELTNLAIREAAGHAIASLCSIGLRPVEGRRRPSGKRSRPHWEPLLHAPEKQRNFGRREAELRFVRNLRLTWAKVVESPAPRTARHADESRDVGPFARLVRECLRLVGASDADPVELIKENNHRFQEMKSRSGDGILPD